MPNGPMPNDVKQLKSVQIESNQIKKKTTNICGVTPPFLGSIYEFNNAEEGICVSFWKAE